MSRAADLSKALNSLHLYGTPTKPALPPSTPSPPASSLSSPILPMAHPTTSPPAAPDKAAVVFPSHVRASFRRNPADRTGELVRLLDDISTVTHGIASYVARRTQPRPTACPTFPTPCLDPKEATRKMYASLSHDGYACIILEKHHEAPLTFDDAALHGGYVVMLSALDVDPTTDDHLLCGTVFSVYKRRSLVSLPGRLLDLQQAAKDQVAAGYVLYSSATTLYYTLGTGAFSFCLHPVATQYFLQPCSALHLPASGPDLYADYEQCKVDKALGATALAICKRHGGKVFDNGSLIANFSGAALSGSLLVHHGVHLLCEAAPLALFMEQLGGKATDGCGNRILDMAIQDEDVHKKVTFCAGPTALVDAMDAANSKPNQPQ